MHSQRGFTLIEIVLVIGILTLLFGLGLFATMDAYRGYTFRSERSIVVSELGKARSRSMNNMYQTAWSVCYDSSAQAYVLFRGSTYSLSATTNESLPAQPSVTVVGLPSCGVGTPITFAQLTGKLVPQLTPATAVLTLTVQETGHADSVITINNEGTIIW